MKTSQDQRAFSSYLITVSPAGGGSLTSKPSARLLTLASSIPPSASENPSASSPLALAPTIQPIPTPDRILSSVEATATKGPFPTTPQSRVTGQKYL